MASLVKLRTLIKPFTSNNTGLFFNAVRTKVYTIGNFKPGPYPKTEEERIKAAKKYGLHPDEYEPYPDDGTGFGDYPKFPMVGTATRDPNLPWTMPVDRRNLHETYHVHDSILGQDRLDLGVKRPVSYPVGISMCCGAIGTIVLLWWICEHFRSYPPVMEKQYPKPGVVHYTFEPAR